MNRISVHIYRCGWCGTPTDIEGNVLHGGAFKKAADIIEAYGDRRTKMTNGSCCSHFQYPQERVTRDMAIDAGDPSLEGQYIK